MISMVVDLVGGIAEALGMSVLSLSLGFVLIFINLLDLGSLDDNLTLPIKFGGRILGFLKLLGTAAS